MELDIEGLLVKYGLGTGGGGGGGGGRFGEEYCYLSRKYTTNINMNCSTL